MTLSDLAARISYLGAMICVISALGFFCAALVIRRLHRLKAQLLAMRLSSAPLSVEGDLPYREIEGGRFEALTYDGYSFRIAGAAGGICSRSAGPAAGSAFALGPSDERIRKAL